MLLVTIRAMRRTSRGFPFGWVLTSVHKATHIDMGFSFSVTGLEFVSLTGYGSIWSLGPPRLLKSQCPPRLLKSHCSLDS